MMRFNWYILIILSLSSSLAFANTCLPIFEKAELSLSQEPKGAADNEKLRKLFVLVQKGESQHWPEIYKLIKKHILPMIIFHMHRNFNSYMEDTIQEVYLELYYMRNELHNVMYPLTWVISVAKYVSLRQVRTLKDQHYIHMPTVAEIADDFEAEESRPNVNDLDIIEVWELIFNKVFPNINPDHAAVIKLRLEGLEFKEIAKKLNIPENTAKTRFFNGKKQLQQLGQTLVEELIEQISAARSVLYTNEPFVITEDDIVLPAIAPPTTPTRRGQTFRWVNPAQRGPRAKSP